MDIQPWYIRATVLGMYACTDDERCDQSTKKKERKKKPVTALSDTGV